ncbi:MAG: hypothetical protein AAB340_03235 [Patescibacteria group bacterium]
MSSIGGLPWVVKGNQKLIVGERAKSFLFPTPPVNFLPASRFGRRSFSVCPCPPRKAGRALKIRIGIFLKIGSNFVVKTRLNFSEEKFITYGVA